MTTECEHQRAGVCPLEHNELLERTVWAKNLPGPVVSLLSFFVEQVVVEKGEYVFREGDHERFLCFLITGHIAIFKENSNHESCELIAVRKGRSFGEMSLFGGVGRSATALAKEQSVLLVLSDDAFNELKREHPKVAIEVMNCVIGDLSHLVRRTTGHLVDYLTPE
jgi:CRP-like cAMP-binding protein